MNIKGLDYNTQRSALILPEYGREVQRMVDYACSLEEKGQRQACAERIVKIMATKVTQTSDNTSFKRMLWDHLYLMSGKQLDIEWPFDLSAAENIQQKPEPLPLPKTQGRLGMRHYGRLITKMLDAIREIPEGPQRDNLIHRAANQMKHNLVSWGHGSMDDERVANDIARMTEGEVNLNLNNFRFSKKSINSVDDQVPANGGKRKRKQ